MEKRKRSKEIDFKYNLRVYWSFLKEYKLLFSGILLVILAMEGLRLVTPFLFKIIIDKGTEYSAGTLAVGSFIAILITIAIVFVSKAVAQSILTFTRLHGINTIDVKLIADVKRRFFNHLIHLDHNFHTTNKTGSLISRLVRSGGSMERMTDVFLMNFAPLILQVIVVSASLMYFSIIPAIIIVVTMIAFIGYSFLMQRLQEGASIESINAEDIEKANVADIFTNIDSIKYFGKENSIKARFKKLSENSKKALLRHWGYYRWMDAVQSLILSTGTFLLVYFSIRQFLAGEITIGTVSFIYLVYGNLMGHLFGFVHGIRNYYRAMADFEVLFQYNKVENEIKNRPNSKNLKIQRGDIEFDDMEFKYGKRKLFDKFNLKIGKNKKVAFVGHSGCGKTSLVKLLYRFYDVNDGAIKIDGKDIRDFKQESLRGEMSIVPQEAILFDDTIFNNIKFSNPSASKDDVMKAMKFAQLDKLVADFPEKENTIVGERGVKLSGGEKQRVSIARAILADKKILVLDEATSALDSETEAEIQKDLERLMQGRTSIIIAHRLSTIMKADKIVVMDKGKIVQMGTHRQLINQRGQYKKLWNLQKGGYIK
jgi:ATP-binding cassette, subfamily B, heavy metal transporter